MQHLSLLKDDGSPNKVSQDALVGMTRAMLAYNDEENTVTCAFWWKVPLSYKGVVHSTCITAWAAPEDTNFSEEPDAVCSDSYQTDGVFHISGLTKNTEWKFRVKLNINKTETFWGMYSFPIKMSVPTKPNPPRVSFVRHTGPKTAECVFHIPDGLDPTHSHSLWVLPNEADIGNPVTVNPGDTVRFGSIKLHRTYRYFIESIDPCGKVRSDELRLFFGK